MGHPHKPPGPPPRGEEDTTRGSSNPHPRPDSRTCRPGTGPTGFPNSRCFYLVPMLYLVSRKMVSPWAFLYQCLSLSLLRPSQIISLVSVSYQSHNPLEFPPLSSLSTLDTGGFRTVRFPSLDDRPSQSWVSVFPDSPLSTDCSSTVDPVPVSVRCRRGPPSTAHLRVERVRRERR